MLLTFRAQQTDSGWHVEQSNALPCTAASRIQSISETYDLVVLQEGTLRVLLSAEHPIHVQLPRILLSAQDESPVQLASTLDTGLSLHGNSPDYRSRRITDLKDGNRQRISVCFNDGESARISLDYRVRDPLVRQCVNAASSVLPSNAVFALRKELYLSLKADTVSLRASQSPWKAFAQVVRSIFDIPSHPHSRRSSAQCSSECTITARLAERTASTPSGNLTSLPVTKSASSLRDRSPGFDALSLHAVLLALHMVGQDCRLAQSRHNDLKKVSSLLMELCAAAGEEDWYDYWMRIMPLSASHRPEIIGEPQEVFTG